MPGETGALCVAERERERERLMNLPCEGDASFEMPNKTSSNPVQTRFTENAHQRVNNYYLTKLDNVAIKVSSRNLFTLGIHSRMQK